MVWRPVFLIFLSAASLSALFPADASGQWQITSPDGKAAFRVGFLVQPQGEWIETPDGESTSQNLFLRRARLILGGEFEPGWSFFIDTDSPNLGKATGSADPAEDKNQGDVFLQDVVLTWTRADALKIDAGMLLVPVSHNTQTGAASLLPVDYGPYSFLHSGPTASRTGRDYGVQARGYPFGRHLEYRLGVFQGYRSEEANEPFRVTARLVWYPFDADTGFFYTGTTLGARRILALGASLDAQGGYRALDADLFYDQPLSGGDGLTLEADFIRYDGRDFFPEVGGEPQLPLQEAWLLEGAYYFGAAKIGPFIQLARRDFRDPASADEDRAQIGLAWWPRGHRLNLKVGFGRLETQEEPDRLQAVVQCQIFTF